jgi:hypothetical protein
MKRSTIVALLGATMALFHGARASGQVDDPEEARKMDGGLFEQVTRAQLEGKPLPAGFRTLSPLTTGDDAQACEAARKGNLTLAQRLAASPIMKEGLRSGNPPASCPDAAFKPTPYPFPYAQQSPAAPESEHPQPGTCNEVGLWDRQRDPSSSRRTAHTIEASVSVANIPPQALCDSNTTPTDATQHNSLHARSSDGSSCIEVVAQRFSGGFIRMWGYDCGQGTGGPANTLDISDYGSDQMYFYMSSVNSGGSGSTWATWFFRFDTNQWVFLGNVTNRATRMRPWAESSGYNATAERHTWFANHRATTGITTPTAWSPRFTCPVQEAFDTHQVMRQSPTAGGSVVFDHTTDSVMCR